MPIDESEGTICELLTRPLLSGSIDRVEPDTFDTIDDAGGCEDPTVLLTADGEDLVFYTGVDAKRAQVAMLLATGRGLTEVTANRVILKAPPGEGSIKEATLAQTSAGDWRLFCEPRPTSRSLPRP